jgi:hypothetical protein
MNGESENLKAKKYDENEMAKKASKAKEKSEIM